MRRSVLIAALLATTALTPQPARAEPITLFLQGLGASLGLYGAAGPAVGLAMGGAAAAGVTAGTFLFGSVAGQLLLSVGLSAVARALQPRPNVPSPSERLVNFAQPITPMEWAFGRVRKGGPYAITSMQGSRRYYGVLLAAHEIDGIEQWYIDQRAVEVAGNGEVETAPYFTGSGAPGFGDSAVNLVGYNGDAVQVADSRFVSAIPEWTNDHDMKGLAYAAVIARRVSDSRFGEVYGNSPATGPAVAPVFRGALVYDPRSDTTAWSDNAALVWAWIVTERLGGAVDWDEIAIEADICDQLVDNAQASQQRRWTLNGSFTDSTDYETLRNQIIAACDGYMFERPDGKLSLRVGRWIEPTITLTEDDFYSLQIAENDWGPSPQTEFVGRYVEPAYDWLEAASATWVADAQARRVRGDVSLFLVDSHNQAMRCLKRIAKASRPRYSLQGEIGMIGYELLKHRFVRVQAHGYDFVLEIGRILRGDTLATLIIEGGSAEATDFDFDAAAEEGERPPRDKPTNDNSVPAPSGLAGSASGESAIEWTWDAQPSELDQQLRWRKVGASTWGAAITLSLNETSYTATNLETGESYEAEIRNLTAAKRASAWHASAAVEIPEP